MDTIEFSTNFMEVCGLADLKGYCNGNISRMARELDVSRSTIINWFENGDEKVIGVQREGHVITGFVLINKV